MNISISRREAIHVVVKHVRNKYADSRDFDKLSHIYNSYKFSAIGMVDSLAYLKVINGDKYLLLNDIVKRMFE